VPSTCGLHIAVTLLADVAIGALDASRSERYVVPDSDTWLPEQSRQRKIQQLLFCFYIH
jgi:hypothetical protein